MLFLELAGFFFQVDDALFIRLQEPLQIKLLLPEILVGELQLLSLLVHSVVFSGLLLFELAELFLVLPGLFLELFVLLLRAFGALFHFC